MTLHHTSFDFSVLICEMNRMIRWLLRYCIVRSSKNIILWLKSNSFLLHIELSKFLFWICHFQSLILSFFNPSRMHKLGVTLYVLLYTIAKYVIQSYFIFPTLPFLSPLVIILLIQISITISWKLRKLTRHPAPQSIYHTGQLVLKQLHFKL